MAAVLNRRSRIHLKLELLQPSGSFKSRGIGQYLLAHLPANPNAHFYSSSGGNAGLACVYAARSLGRPASVVVPLSTKPLMITKLHAAGATEVIQMGQSWAEADAYLREELLVKDPTGVYVPPFDHPEIWAGHSTVIDEIYTQLEGKAPDAIICSCGGGGLFNGVMEGLDRAAWSSVPVLVMETAGAESLYASVQAGELVTLPGITSQATSLGARRVSAKSFEYAQRENVKCVVLDDAEAAMGCYRLADDERLMVELACGVNVALCYDGRLERALGRKLSPDANVVIILCGGSNVTVNMMAEWRKEFGYIEKMIPKHDGVPSDVVAPNGINGVNGGHGVNGVRGA